MSDQLDLLDPSALRAFESRLYRDICPLVPRSLGSVRLPENTHDIADILGRFQTTRTLESMYMCMRGLVDVVTRRVGTVLPWCLADVVARYVVGYTRCQTIATINDLPPKTEMSNLSKLCMMWLHAVTPTVAYVVASQATWEHNCYDFPIQNLSKLQRLGRTTGELGQIAILAFPLIAVIVEGCILIIDVVRVAVTRRITDCHNYQMTEQIATSTNAKRTHLFWTTTDRKIHVLDLRLSEPSDPFTSERCSDVKAIYPFGENRIATLHATMVSVWRYEDRTFTHLYTTMADFDGEYGANIRSLGVIRTETGFHIAITSARGHICVWDDTGTRIQTILRRQYACVLGETSLGGAKGGFAVVYDADCENGCVELFAC